MLHLIGLSKTGKHASLADNLLGTTYHMVLFPCQPVLWELFGGSCLVSGEYIILSVALPSTHHKFVIQILSFKSSLLLLLYKGSYSVL